MYQIQDENGNPIPVLHPCAAPPGESFRYWMKSTDSNRVELSPHKVYRVIFQNAAHFVMGGEDIAASDENEVQDGMCEMFISTDENHDHLAVRAMATDSYFWVTEWH